MKPIVTILISLFMLPNIMIGQSFSKAEQEVIEGVESYWADFNGKDKNKYQNVFHDSYKGWDVGSEYINTKKDNIKWNDYTWGKDEVLFWNITPIGVVLHDDIAVVHYYYTTISKNKKNGKKTTEKGKWTDVIINDGGKWKLVADHGGKIESNTEE